MVIYKIKFKRTKESEWESGIKIDSNQFIYHLDKNGYRVNNENGFLFYIVKNLRDDFCIDLTPILKD